MSLDPIKAGIAAEIARALKTAIPQHQSDAEVRSVDELTTLIRVPTHHGPRYFTVKVSESR